MSGLSDGDAKKLQREMEEARALVAQAQFLFECGEVEKIADFLDSALVAVMEARNVVLNARVDHFPTR